MFALLVSGRLGRAFPGSCRNYGMSIDYVWPPFPTLLVDNDITISPNFRPLPAEVEMVS